MNGVNKHLSRGHNRACREANCRVPGRGQSQRWHTVPEISGMRRRVKVSDRHIPCHAQGCLCPQALICWSHALTFFPGHEAVNKSANLSDVTLFCPFNVGLKQYLLHGGSLRSYWEILCPRSSLLLRVQWILSQRSQ